MIYKHWADLCSALLYHATVRIKHAHSDRQQQVEAALSKPPSLMHTYTHTVKYSGVHVCFSVN